MAEIKKFRGLRNTTSPERFRTGDLDTAVDVEMDDTGRVLTRRGLTPVVAATPMHSLYANHVAAVVMEGAALRAINPDFSRTTLRTLSNSNPVSYDTVADTIYYSNGTDTGRLVGLTPKAWGITPPVGQPAAAPVPGTLPPGRYLYAMTFIRTDGHESGTGLAGAIDLPAGGGIQFSGMEVSTNAEVSDKILYVSSQNGEVPFRAAIVPNAQTSYLLTEQARGVPLTTQFAEPPPPGTMVRYYNGHMCVVVGDVVYYSDPYGLELFRREGNFLRFPGQIAVFECVNKGIFVATTDLAGDDPETAGGSWYLSGARMDKLDSTQIFDYGAIPGTGVKTQAGYFNTEFSDEGGAIEAATPAVVWASRHGVCVGFDGGQARNLTEAMYSFPVAQHGVGLVRQARGFVQYLSVLRGAGAANNSA